MELAQAFDSIAGEEPDHEASDHALAIALAGMSEDDDTPVQFRGIQSRGRQSRVRQSGRQPSDRSVATDRSRSRDRTSGGARRQRRPQTIRRERNNRAPVGGSASADVSPDAGVGEECSTCMSQMTAR